MNACRILLNRSVFFHSYNKSFCTCKTLNRTQKQFSESISKSELRMRQQDGLSDEYRIVYNAPLKNYINSASIVSFGSLIGFGAYSTWRVYLTTGILGLQLHNLLDAELVNYTHFEIGVFVCGFIATNVALWKTSSQYALRIYSKENAESASYCCVMTGLLPLTTRQIKFQAGELRQVGGLMSKLPWRDNYFCLGSTKLILLHNYFRTPADLHEMMKS